MSVSNSRANRSRQRCVEFGESRPTHETEMLDAKPTEYVDLAEEGESTRLASTDPVDQPHAPVQLLAESRLMLAVHQGSEGNTGDKNSQAEEFPSSGHIACPKCGAERAAKSRLVRQDAWRIRLTPSRPYRCLRCYNRFWQKEPFLDDKRRVKFLILTSLAITLLVLWMAFKPANSGDYAAGNTLQSDLEPDTIASLPSNTMKSKPESQRELVESAGFRPPRKADSETSELRNAGLSDTEIDLRLLTLKHPKPDVSLNAAAAPSGASGVQSEKITNAPEQSVPNQARSEPPPIASLEPAKLEVESTQMVSKADKKAEELSQHQEKVARLTVLKTIENWRRSWSSGDAERYLEFYTEDFTPQSGESNRVWREQRRARVSPSRGISVAVSNAQVVFDSSNQVAAVSFDQNYRANNYQQTSRKELRLNKKLNQWYIDLEREL